MRKTKTLLKISHKCHLLNINDFSNFDLWIGYLFKMLKRTCMFIAFHTHTWIYIEDRVQLIISIRKTHNTKSFLCFMISTLFIHLFSFSFMSPSALVITENSHVDLSTHARTHTQTHKIKLYESRSEVYGLSLFFIHTHAKYF